MIWIETIMCVVVGIFLSRLTYAVVDGYLLTRKLREQSWKYASEETKKKRVETLKRIWSARAEKLKEENHE